MLAPPAVTLYDPATPPAVNPLVAGAFPNRATPKFGTTGVGATCTVTSAVAVVPCVALARSTYTPFTGKLTAVRRAAGVSITAAPGPDT
jgi:hypothetical protein